MKNEPVTDALLREFLLGKLADKDRERIEDLFLTDSPIRERALALEQDLIDDYLDGSLSQEDQERFLARYQTDEQRRQLRIAGAIREWAVNEAKVPRPIESTASGNRFWTRIRLKPRFWVPVAVAIVVAVVLAIVWLNNRSEQQRHFAIEQELAQLNSPASLGETPSEMISSDLRPVSGRSIELPVEIRIPSEIRLVQLQLPWIQNERFPLYQAEVRRIGNRESFTIPNLQAAESNGRPTIRLRLPAKMLKRGQYQINLMGVAADGSPRSSEEYSFVVVN